MVVARFSLVDHEIDGLVDKIFRVGDVEEEILLRSSPSSDDPHSSLVGDNCNGKDITNIQRWWKVCREVLKEMMENRERRGHIIKRINIKLIILSYQLSN